MTYRSSLSGTRWKQPKDDIGCAVLLRVPHKPKMMRRATDADESKGAIDVGGVFNAGVDTGIGFNRIGTTKAMLMTGIFR